MDGLHLYSAFIQSAVQLMPLIHPFTHTFTHQWRLAAMQGTNQLVRSNWGLGVLLRDTSTHPGWDRTGNPPTARRQLYLLSYIAPIPIQIILGWKVWKSLPCQITSLRPAPILLCQTIPLICIMCKKKKSTCTISVVFLTGLI